MAFVLLLLLSLGSGFGAAETAIGTAAFVTSGGGTNVEGCGECGRLSGADDGNKRGGAGGYSWGEVGATCTGMSRSGPPCGIKIGSPPVSGEKGLAEGKWCPPPSSIGGGGWKRWPPPPVPPPSMSVLGEALVGGSPWGGIAMGIG